MANKKITDLTELTSVATGDFLPIVDVSDTSQSSAGTTKKITQTNYVGTTFAPLASPTFTGTVTTDVLTATGVITGLSGTWDAGGMDIATGDSYAINGTDVLTATVLGTGVVTSSLTAVGTIGTGVWEGTDVTVANGGTGLSTATAYVVLCGGTTSTAAFQSIAGVGTSGQILTSNGAGSLPTFKDLASDGFFGNGAEGSLSVTSSTDPNSVKTNVDVLSAAGQKVLSVAATASFSTGDHVVVHQSQHSSGTGPGLWEINSIASISAGVSVTMDNNLANAYQAAGAQMVKMNEYTEVEFKTGSSLSTAGWGGTDGGIVAFYASQSVFIEEGVTIGTVGDGFRGGAGGTGAGTDGTSGESERAVGSVSDAANRMGGAGGDASDSNDDGGGGAGAKAGSVGDNGAAPGGSSYVDNITDYVGGTPSFAPVLMFGGGGGGGANSGGSSTGTGGDGGGVVIIVCPSIRVIGSLSAQGATGVSGAEDGGNGGSGSIALYTTQLIGFDNVTVASNAAGTGGPGGEGSLFVGYTLSQIPQS